MFEAFGCIHDMCIMHSVIFVPKSLNVLLTESSEPGGDVSLDVRVQESVADCRVSK